MTVWMHILDEPPPLKFKFLGRERDVLTGGDRVAMLEENSGKRFIVNLHLWELKGPNQIADLVLAKAAEAYRKASA